jgi:hypothetical protein
MEMGARCAGDEVGGRSCWWRQEWWLVVLATRRWALVVLATTGWGVMLAMSASMLRAMDACAGEVLSGLLSDWRRGGGRRRRTGNEGVGARLVGDEGVGW